MLFADEDQAAKAHRDPVAPAKRSAAAERKAVSHTRADGAVAHSFRTLLDELATLVRNNCRAPGATAESAPTFDLLTTPTPLQRRAFELIDQIAVQIETARPNCSHVSEVKEKLRSAITGT